jgi:hypothetical protein
MKTREPSPYPGTFDDLVKAGGPRAYINDAARQGAEREARFWLGVVRDMRARMGRDDLLEAATADGYIKELRRMLRERPTLEEARAKTRERVRRHRERRRGMSEAEIVHKAKQRQAHGETAPGKRLSPIGDKRSDRRAAERVRMMSALGPQKLGNAAAAVRFLVGRGEEPTAEAISALMGMPVAIAAAALETLRAQGHYDRIVSEAAEP